MEDTKSTASPHRTGYTRPKGGNRCILAEQGLRGNLQKRTAAAGWWMLLVVVAGDSVESRQPVEQKRQALDNPELADNVMVLRNGGNVGKK